MNNKWWSEIDNLEDAEKATKAGFWAAVCVAVITAGFASYALVSQKSILSIDPWAYVDAVLFAVIAWGIYRHSKFFALAGVGLFIVEKVVAFQTIGFTGWPLAMALLLLFIQGARGVFAWHRLVDEAGEETIEEDAVMEVDEETTAGSRSRMIGIAILLVTALVAYTTYGSLLQNYIAKIKTDRALAQQAAELDSFLSSTAIEVNKTLPIKVDEETRLDSVSGENKKLTYHYTMVNYTEGSLDKNVFDNAMMPLLVEKICSNDKMKIFFTKNIPLAFSYYDNAGKLFTSLTVTADLCSDPRYQKSAAAEVGDKEQTYTVMRPESWINQDSLVESADFVIADVPLKNAIFAYLAGNGQQGLVDASNLHAITLSSKLENPVISTCVPQARTDGTDYCEISISGCTEGTCLTYLVSTLKNNNRILFLGGWSDQAESEQFAPIYHQVLDSFRWKSVSMDTAPDFAPDSAAGSIEE